MLYPKEVQLDEGNIRRLAALYKKAYQQIESELEGATSFGSANRRQILAQIKANLTSLGVNVNDIIDSDLSSSYEAGADDAVKQLKNIGAPIKVESGFNKIHQEAIAALVDDTQTAFGESMQGVSRSASNLLGKGVRDQITEQMAIGKVGGEALRTIKNNVVGQFRTEGLDALIDKGGRGWSLDRYSEMLIRTKSVEARNRGMVNRMAQNGYDLVQVSAHGADDDCGDWEGEILSISGDTAGYPTVADAEAGGLFHPNCKHALNAVVPELAALTEAYNPEEETMFVPGGSIIVPVKNRAEKLIFGPAKTYQTQFSKNVKDIAKAVDKQFQIGPPKDPERGVQKILNDYNGSIMELKDTNRGVIFINDPESDKEFKAILEAVKEQYEVVRIEDNLDVKDGYAKTIINVSLPHGTGEIQVTTEEMWDAKTKGGGDKLYEKVRAAQGEVEKLEEKMNDLYEEAASETEERLGKD